MNMSKGFTLVEVFIALLVVSIGIGGVIALVGQTSAFGANASSQLMATFLAQEGVEIARNIRDSNFLAIHNGGTVAWDAGLAGCTSSQAGCEADYTSTVLTPLQDRFLNFVNGFYSYSPGAQTQFKRKIFADGSGDTRTVTVQVTWQERGRSHTVTGATLLYNWLTPSP